MPKNAISMVSVLTLVMTLALTGCGGGDKPKADSGSGDKPKDHDHGPGEKHAHKDDKKAGAGHGGEVIALGESTFGPYKMKASRDQGVIKAGGDAPIDVWIDPASAPAPKVVGVRFWIGTQDASGSVKAKAEIEDPKDPSRWHVHAEVPDPLPAGSKLWVEIEDDKGALTLASFELKA